MTTATRLRLAAEIPNWRPKSSDYSQNARRHPFAAATAVKAAHKKVGDALLVAGWPRELPPGRRFTLTFRVEQAAGPMADSDNAIASLKACRDAVAKWLGTTDAVRGPITWEYRYSGGRADRVAMVLEEVE